MSAVPTNRHRNAVQHDESHSFHSHTSRLQAGDPDYVVEKQRVSWLSLGLHAIALLSFILLSDWCRRVIGQAISAPLGSFGQAIELFFAVLMAFLGSFAFMRLAQAGLRAIFRADNTIEWPREDVDWGRQAVVLDSDGLAIANRLARRTYAWNSMAELNESDVFVVKRKQGAEIVIPKDPEDEDHLRQRLMRGISLSDPVSRRRR